MAESTVHIRVSAALDTAVASLWSSRERSGRPRGTLGDEVGDAGAGEEIAAVGEALVASGAARCPTPQALTAQASAVRKATRGGRPGAAMGTS
ncbi:hypothetical protein GCM10009527_053590 [Actinomadura nitritigenes]